MLFEFDPHKSASNKIKHGIDFVEAQALWQSPRIELNANQHEDEEVAHRGADTGLRVAQLHPAGGQNFFHVTDLFAGCEHRGDGAGQQP